MLIRHKPMLKQSYEDTWTSKFKEKKGTYLF